MIANNTICSHALRYEKGKLGSPTIASETGCCTEPEEYMDVERNEGTRGCLVYRADVSEFYCELPSCGSLKAIQHVIVEFDRNGLNLGPLRHQTALQMMIVVSKRGWEER